VEAEEKIRLKQYVSLKKTNQIEGENKKRGSEQALVSFGKE
jgi:hypothetical protein